MRHFCSDSDSSWVYPSERTQENIPSDTDQEWEKITAANQSSNVENRAVEERKSKKKFKKKNQVLLEGYVDAVDDMDDLKRTKSLTDDDLDELKGCLDLGFGFSYDEIPELCNTLPALELCYSMSQKFLDEQQHSKYPENKDLSESGSSPIASWKISSPGDNPDDVKARLKYWAQAVACTVKLCS